MSPETLNGITAAIVRVWNISLAAVRGRSAITLLPLCCALKHSLLNGPEQCGEVRERIRLFPLGVSGGVSLGFVSPSELGDLHPTSLQPGRGVVWL